MSLERARAVADAVLYEGYLLYPYRATSSRNQTRWQLGVLGPVGAEDAGVGESPTMSMQCLLTSSTDLMVHLRFLQLQHRSVHDTNDTAVAELTDADGTTWLSWDEAVEQDLTFELSPFDLEAGGTVLPVAVGGGVEVAQLGNDEGRAVRRRWPLSAEMHLATAPMDGCLRLDVEVLNLQRRPVLRRRRVNALLAHRHPRHRRGTRRGVRVDARAARPPGRARGRVHAAPVLARARR